MGWWKKEKKTWTGNIARSDEYLSHDWTSRDLSSGNRIRLKGEGWALVKPGLSSPPPPNTRTLEQFYYWRVQGGVSVVIPLCFVRSVLVRMLLFFDVVSCHCNLIRYLRRVVFQWVMVLDTRSCNMGRNVRKRPFWKCTDNEDSRRF